MVRISAAGACLAIAAVLSVSPAAALATDPVTTNDPAAATTFSKLQATLASTPVLGIKAKYTSSDPAGPNFTLDGTLSSRFNYFYGTMLLGTSKLTLYATAGRTLAKAPYKACWKKAPKSLGLSTLGSLLFAAFDADSWTGTGSPGPALFASTGPNTMHWTVPGTASNANADVSYDPATNRFLTTTVTQVLAATASAPAETFAADVKLKYQGFSTKRPKHTKLCR